ncbi:MAG: hypothetical protein ACOX4U_05515 [Anaerovoracaceae bacterium]|jgi:hypothetical protein
MQQNKLGGILSQDEIIKAQNEMNPGKAAGSGSFEGQNQSGSGGSVKPEDIIRAKEEISGIKTGGDVDKADKVEAQNKMF